MPTYEYKCPKCRTVFDVFQRMKDKPGAKCPKCGAKAARQMSGGHGIHFKGTGFYETDYKRAGQKKPPAEGGAGSGSSDGPPSGKAGGSSSGSGGSVPSTATGKSSGGSSGSASSGSTE
jgi:putative FmdB family regulatory protein